MFLSEPLAKCRVSPKSTIMVLVAGTVDADVLLERLAIGGQKLAVTVGLRRGDAAKLFARHILYGGRRVILIDHEDLLVVWKRGYGIAIPFAHLDHVGE